MMKFNFLLLSAAALLNCATAIDPFAAVDLGSAINYAILSTKGISTVPTSSITGDIAVSPIAATAMTGFSLTKTAGDSFSTSTQFTGKAYAPEYSAAVDTLLTTAVGDMGTAYTNAIGRATSDAEDENDPNNAQYLNFETGLLGGKTLTPGVYTFESAISIADKDLTFDGAGVYIIQTTSNVVVAADKEVLLQGGATAENIFWQVAGHVDVAAGAHMEGVILCNTHVAFAAGSSLNGRVLAQTAVTLDSTTITPPDARRRALEVRGVCVSAPCMMHARMDL
jgi:hypothetical protein